MKSIKIPILLALLFVTTIVCAQEKLSFSDISANTKNITTAYFNAYISLDFEAMKNQVSEDISFNDPTAKLIFGGDLVEGKTTVFENFKKGYAAIIEMNSEITRTIFSGNIGVFEIELTYKFKAGADKIITISKMPLIVILTLKDGKIIEHRDFGDYNIFLKQYSEQTKQ